MVRHKTRWLIVQLNFQEDGERPLLKLTKTASNMTSKSPSDAFPSTSEVFGVLRDLLVTTFGLIGEGIVVATQGTFDDCRITEILSVLGGTKTGLPDAWNLDNFHRWIFLRIRPSHVLFSRKRKLYFVVRFCDPKTRLVLIRVPREDCEKVRLAVSLIKSLPVSTTSSSTTTRAKGRPVVASVKSIHGSARTMKLAALRFVRQWYRSELCRMASQKSDLNPPNSNLQNENERDRKKLLTQLQETLMTIQRMDSWIHLSNWFGLEVY